MDLPVIAECVDARSGKRYYPGDTFPDPDAGQVERLTAAGCFAKDAASSPKAGAETPAKPKPRAKAAG